MLKGNEKLMKSILGKLKRIGIVGEKAAEELLWQ